MYEINNNVLPYEAVSIPCYLSSGLTKYRLKFYNGPKDLVFVNLKESGENIILSRSDLAQDEVLAAQSTMRGRLFGLIGLDGTNIQEGLKRDGLYGIVDDRGYFIDVLNDDYDLSDVFSVVGLYEGKPSVTNTHADLID